MANKAAEEFFDSLPKEEETNREFNIFEEPKEPEGKTDTNSAPTEPKEPEEIESEERKKPRRSELREEQRRYYEEQLAKEREERARLDERLKAIESSKKVEIDPDIKKLLTETKDPEEASAIFASLLSKMRTEAEDAALERMVAREAEGDSEVNAIHANIEDAIERIEDRYGVDLTDDTTTRNAFLDFVDSIAPEDSDDLPNMGTAWQLFQATRKAPTSNVERKQQIASRGMVRSVNAKPEGKDLKPMSFEEMNNGGWWDKLIGRAG